ncbi:MAG TPA: hypothetical protein VHE55_11905 [Fimbriimonadaceae bacterium]|nr:hypothetical protein [Fimbriimonadaceae bacterium]
MASSGRLSLQVRWQRGTPSDLNRVLEAYLRRLRKGSKEPFKADRHEDDGSLLYHWVGDGQGRGSLFCSDGLVHFLEITGARRDSLLPHLRSSLDSFRRPGGDYALWSVLGLRVWIPTRLELSRHDFLAGKTSLHFRGRLDRLECVRWGLAERLLHRQGLEEWARAACRLSSADAFEEGDGLRLEKAGRLGRKVVLVRHEPEHNQIVTVSASLASIARSPSWAWFGEEAPA